MMVHDYNNIVYHGTFEAVTEWADNNKVSYVPIPDIAGTVILVK